MSERVVKVTITAQVNSYLSGMDQVAKKAREGRSEAEQLTATLDAQRKACEITGRSMMIAGGIVAAGLVLATKRAADFDSAMSNVAATGADARANLEGLRDAAIDAGASTVFSASQSAAAIEELAKAGVGAKDILGGGLTGALDLAAAGGIDVAQAAEIASNSLNQFKLDGSDASRVADVLAAGAGKASGGVDDLGMALSQTGQVANAMGLSIEETTAGLAAFASAGLKGSDAGTSFKTMLGALTPNSAQAAEEMERLGINAFDVQGKFIGLEAFAGNLQSSLKGLTDQQRQASLEIMFGSDAVRAGIELYNQGASGIREWISAVDDAGYASKTAQTRLDNLNGDLEKLSGSFDTALISIGGAGQGPLRQAVQGLTDLVDTFNAMPEGGQAAVFWIGAVGAAAALAGGTFFIAVPKIAAFNAGLADMGPNAQRAGRVLGTIGKGAGGIVAATTAIVVATSALVDYTREIRGTDDAVAAAWTTNRGFLKSMEDLGVVTEGSTKATKRALDALASGNVLGTVGIDIASLRDGLTELQSGLEGIPIDTAVSRFQAWSRELGLTTKQQKTLLDEMPQLRDQIQQHLSSTGDAADRQAVFEFATRRSTDAVQSATEAYQAQAAEANGVRDALASLMDQINAQNDAQQQAIQANAQWVQGLADLAAQVQENGTSLDETTAAGSRNADMLAGLAGQAQSAAQAQYEVDQQTMSAEDSTRKYVDTLAAQKQQFEASAIAAGFNADQVRALSDRIFQMPSEKEVQVLVDTAGANDALTRFINSSSAKVIRIGITTYRKDGADITFQNGNSSIIGRANGGILPGAPSNTDNMIAAVATGEFIVRASQTAIPENRRVLEYINSGGRMRGYAAGGLVGGGFAQPVYASPSSRTSIDYEQLGRSLATALGEAGPKVNLNISNPVVRDLMQESWEASQIIGGALL